MGILATTDMTWANNAPAATVVNVDVPAELPTPIAVTVRNPSAVTALTVKLQCKETLGGAARFADVAAVAVPAGSVKTFFVDELVMLAEAVRLAVSNDTLLGATAGFTGQIRVRQR